MKINNALRKTIEPLLPNDYRQVIVDRLKKKNISVHPNTVKNVLDGSENPTVALEILKLANEMRESQKQFNDLAKQLSKERAA